MVIVEAEVSNLDELGSIVMGSRLPMGLWLFLRQVIKQFYPTGYLVLVRQYLQLLQPNC